MFFILLFILRGAYINIALAEPSRLNLVRVWLCVCVHVLNHVWHFATPWIVAHHTSLSVECSRQEYWNGLSFYPPGDLLDPVIKLHLLCFLHWQAGSLPLSHLGSPRVWLTSWQFEAWPPEPIKVIVLGLADDAFTNTAQEKVWSEKSWWD